MDKTYANEEVLNFYKALPFNFKESTEQAVKDIKNHPLYPALAPLLKKGMRVLDVGSGVGWLANTMAYHHQCNVTGIDFNPVAVVRAREIADILGIPVEYVITDLFNFRPETPYDLVTSLGVLHHTDNCMEGARKAASFCKPGGLLYIGLYHLYGRRPFLDHFQKMKDAGKTEEEMLCEYKKLHSNLKEEKHLLSWFRDQVMHPHESQHTLAELLETLSGENCTLLSTSINIFNPITSVADVLKMEAAYEDLGRQRLRELKYFPGFFISIFKKNQPA